MGSRAYRSPIFLPHSINLLHGSSLSPQIEYLVLNNVLPWDLRGRRRVEGKAGGEERREGQGERRAGTADWKGAANA